MAGTPAIRVRATDASPISSLELTGPAEFVGEGTLLCEPPPSNDSSNGGGRDGPNPGNQTPDARDGARCELVSALNTALFPAGEVTITARAIDIAGNAGDVSVTVTINNSIPEIAVSSPASGIASGTIDIRADAADPDGIANFSVLVPGAVFQPVCALPALITNSGLELDPTLIHVPWETALMPEGRFVSLHPFLSEEAVGSPFGAYWVENWAA